MRDVRRYSTIHFARIMAAMRCSANLCPCTVIPHSQCGETQLRLLSADLSARLWPTFGYEPNLGVNYWKCKLQSGKEIQMYAAGSRHSEFQVYEYD